TMPTYDIKEEERPSTPTATVRVLATLDRIPQEMGRIFSEVYGYLASIGVAPVGAPFACYHSMSGRTVGMEVGTAVAKAVPEHGRGRAGQLPDGTVAVTWHIGPYEALRNAYEAIEAWMKACGRAPGGPPCEFYFTDPRQEPDPSKWRTEVVWRTQRRG
ncbi:MAG: GyrI-like domain-containing protein, partial [SAR202 cluster bacterium]|nr:GyrI-like domain-containing protein [SAR202 cluster bacterium]